MRMNWILKTPGNLTSLFGRSYNLQKCCLEISESNELVLYLNLIEFLLFKKDQMSNLTP